MSEESLSFLGLLHVCRHKDMDIGNLVSEFANLKRRYLTLVNIGSKKPS